MKTSQVFGGRCIELLANYDQELQSWRMLQMSFVWADPMLLEVLPQSGMIVNGQLFGLQILDFCTAEQDGFVLPTPTHHANNNPHTPSAWNRNSDPGVQYAKAFGITKEQAIQEGYQLNPLFVEELMGFPIGWTDVQP